MGTTMLRRGEDYDTGIIQDEKPGQISSEARDVYEAICIIEGSAEYWVEDQYYKAVAGDVLLIPAGAMVGAALKEKGCPFLRACIWMSRRYITFLKLQDDTADFSFMLAKNTGHYLLRLPKEKKEKLIANFKKIAESDESDKISTELYTKAALAALCAKINRLVHSGGADIMLSGEKNRLSAVLSHIHQKCTEPISVEELAKEYNYSASHLAHSFKKQTGVSLYRYVLLRRLQIGRKAMLDGVPVKEAYQRCGFSDYAGFYRAFTKEFGLSPQQYKKQNQ